TTSGLIKNGSGTLSLGGTAANTFVGTNKINAGTILAAKANALGSGNALILGGGTFHSGGLNQALGILDMDGNATIDFGAGTSGLTFLNSAAVNWNSATLNILDWTSGSDSLRF